MTAARVSCTSFLLAFSVLLFPGNPTWAETNYELRQRAMQAMKAQDFAGAQQALLELVQREPSADNYNYLASAEAAGGQVSLAIGHLQKSIQLGNRTATVYYNLGVMEMQANQLNAAKVAFQHAIDLDAKHSAARYGLGMALLLLGHPQEAADVIQNDRQVRHGAGELRKLR